MTIKELENRSIIESVYADGHRPQLIYDILFAENMFIGNKLFRFYSALHTGTLNLRININEYTKKDIEENKIRER